MPPKKFDLRNPAANIIGGAAVPAAAEKEAPAQDAESAAQEWERAGRPEPPAGYKVNRAFVETKSRRLQLLIQPSLYMRVKERAQRDGVSVNEMISRLLAAGLESKEV